MTGFGRKLVETKRIKSWTRRRRSNGYPNNDEIRLLCNDSNRLNLVVHRRHPSWPRRLWLLAVCGAQEALGIAIFTERWLTIKILLRITRKWLVEYSCFSVTSENASHRNWWKNEEKNTAHRGSNMHIDTPRNYGWNRSNGYCGVYLSPHYLWKSTNE